MKRSCRLWALSGALTLCASAPALAAHDPIGSVDLGPGLVHARAFTDFGGPVEGLSFRAQSDIYCDSITTTSQVGRTQEIYSGELKAGLAQTIELPLDQQDVRSIDFDCTSSDGMAGAIEISAELGTYREQWLSDPTWSRRSQQTVSWLPLGHERFTGSFDRETETAGSNGQFVSALGLRPVDDDAHCSNITARFADGSSQSLDMPASETLSEDVIYQIDLPTPHHNLTSVDMQCTALGDDDVTIEVYAAG